MLILLMCFIAFTFLYRCNLNATCLIFVDTTPPPLITYRTLESISLAQPLRLLTTKRPSPSINQSGHQLPKIPSLVSWDLLVESCHKWQWSQTLRKTKQRCKLHLRLRVISLIICSTNKPRILKQSPLRAQDNHLQNLWNIGRKIRHF